MRTRDYGTTRGYPNESEYTVVKVRSPLAGTRTALTLGQVDFYNNIKTYLSELANTDMKSLEDLVQYI